MVVKTDSGIKGLADLSGKTVAVQTDTTGNDYANQYASQDGYSVLVFDDGGTALNAIISGRAQAVIIDRAIAYSFVDSTPGTEVATEFQTGEEYGFDAQLNDPNAAALIDVVNEVLTTANSDGTYLSLYKKWIDPNATSASLPQDATSATSSPTPAA
jgi:polar amino acid transport system substrate-binding protein